MRLTPIRPRRKRVIDIERFLRDHNIPFITSGHKHCAEGWVQIVCPFCTGSPGWHLGYNKIEGYWNCWRCGWKRETTVLERLLRLSDPAEQKALLERYTGRITGVSDSALSDPSTTGRMPPTLPVGSEKPGPRHRAYLERRRFDPDRIEREWEILGTGPIGPYKHRIIIPIYYGGVLVSYQGRDITGKAYAKYKACPKSEEFIHHKHILYGLDKVKFDSVVVVEGVMDVWRLGQGAVATFGVGWTWEQVDVLTRFRRVFILFDPEDNAQRKAQDLGRVLAEFGNEVEVVRLHITEDPGDMPDDDAECLMRELGVR